MDQSENRGASRSFLASFHPMSGADSWELSTSLQTDRRRDRPVRPMARWAAIQAASASRTPAVRVPSAT